MIEIVDSGKFKPDPSKFIFKFVKGICNGLVKVIVAVITSFTSKCSLSS